jgi:hypothetical protein
MWVGNATFCRLVKEKVGNVTRGCLVTCLPNHLAGVVNVIRANFGLDRRVQEGVARPRITYQSAPS